MVRSPPSCLCAVGRLSGLWLIAKQQGMSTGTELVMLLRGRAPLAVAMTASAQPNKVLTPRTTVARSKSGVSGRNIMYFIRGVSDRPIQCVIRVSCYENYTRNTQTALVCTLLPVSYMLRCACWTSVCTKLCRRGQDVEHHRRARCDGSSALDAAGVLDLPQESTAGRQAAACCSIAR